MGRIMLKTKTLRVAYNPQVVIDFPNLVLARGDSCLINGASGCGKTTLLYTIAGLIKPAAGEIVIDGTDITKQTEAQRDHFRGKKIGMIFQTLHLVKHLSVINNLHLASYAAGVSHQPEHANYVLQQLGMYEKKDALPETLSQGQAQRVAIARAILHSPALILADEPTSSLDDASCESVITLIKQAAEEANASLLISTHDSRVKRHFSQIISLEAST